MAAASASAGASASGVPTFTEQTSSSAHHADVIDALRENHDFDFYDRRDELAKIERGDNRTIEVLIRDRLPLGALVYKDALDDQYANLGRCLAVRAIVVLNHEQEGASVDPLVRRAIEVARAKRAEGVYVKIIGEPSIYSALRDSSFKTSRVWKERKTTRLMYHSLDRGADGAEQHYRSSSNGKRGADGSSLAGRPVEKRARASRAQDDQPQRTLQMHSIPLRNPYLGQIKSGRKTIEGRINTGMMLRLREGDRVRFHNQTDSVMTEIKRITRYDSFGEMLTAEGVEACLPGVRTVAEGVGIYDRIPSYRQKAAQFGVLGIELKLIS